MDSEELYNRDIAERARNFERLLESGENFFYDTDELEEIIEFYLDEEALEKAMSAINYGSYVFPFETYYPTKKAEVYIAKKEAKQAITILEDIRSREPNNQEVARLLGDAYFLNMQFRKSVEYYEDALKDTDEHEELIIKLARIHFLLNKPGKALAYLNSFPADFFFDDTILPDLVKLFYDHGFAKKAIAFLQKIIDNDPYNYSAWYFLGFTYQKLEDFSKAVTAFEYAIAIDDDNTMGYLGKGNALMDLGKYKEAIEFLYQAFDNDITDAEILCNIAECYENLDELSRARYYYAKALKLDNNLSDAYYGLAVIAKKKEEYSDAVNSLHSAIDKDPFESLYHVELAELYLLLNEHDKAIYHYLKGLEIDPDTIEIVLDVSQAYLENDQSELSIGLLKNQLERFSEDHRLLYRISSYLFQSGNYQDGYEYLHLALQKKPEEYHLLYEYAPFLESNETITNIIDLYHS